MWRNHQSIYQYHLKYICNDIAKPFRVGIICYSERVQEMNNLDKHIPPPFMKYNGYESANWKVRDKELFVNYIRVEIKYRLPSSMQDELENNQEVYHYLTHEYWCDLLSTIKVKDNRKRIATQIKNISSAIAASHYDSYVSIRILMKMKAGDGVLRNKGPNKKTPNHHYTQGHFVLCKNSVIPAQKYMSHIAKDCFDKRSE